MRKLTLLLFCLPLFVNAQKWVDTTYQIAIDRDSIYGTAIDFAGNTETLTMDIAYPTNDTPPQHGRPLIVVLYGGAWMGGTKNDLEVQRLMQDFAKRGYVAIAPNYRLGMFQTASAWNCNLSNLFNVEWNCLNAQDTAEWYRAYYRAVQDVKGAIRYIERKEVGNHQINAQNIFVTGFSAGGFNALGVAFLDHASEWKSFADAMGTAQTPNAIYDNGCVKKYQWDTSIASMNLQRPNLGSLAGDLNLPTYPHRIRAVGNFFGGMFYNLLDSSTYGTQVPAIYGFHQPNDLIVPYQSNRKVFHGFNACAYSVCNLGILNRPYVHSSASIKDWANDLKNQGKSFPDFYFDSTLNNTDCAGQIADPSKGGHQLDNWSRTWNMATFFASKIDTNANVVVKSTSQMHQIPFQLYPNPAASEVTILSHSNIQEIQIFTIDGKQIYCEPKHNQSINELNISHLSNGIYFIFIKNNEGYGIEKLIISKH